MLIRREGTSKRKMMNYYLYSYVMKKQFHTFVYNFVYT